MPTWSHAHPSILACHSTGLYLCPRTYKRLPPATLTLWPPQLHPQPGAPLLACALGQQLQSCGSAHKRPLSHCIPASFDCPFRESIFPHRCCPHRVLPLARTHRGSGQGRLGGTARWRMLIGSGPLGGPRCEVPSQLCAADVTTLRFGTRRSDSFFLQVRLRGGASHKKDYNILQLLPFRQRARPRRRAV
jgi:hypothetical protein